MKKLLVSAAAALVALLGMSLVAMAPPQGQATGSARLTPINQSGIEAEILFLDTGSNVHGLVVSGKASGLNPAKSYFSLLYDVGSVPGGPNACTPPANNDLTGAQMFTAFWAVAPDGTGTLFRQKAGAAYVPLSDVATVSIRRVTPGQNPPFFDILEACGEVNRNP